MPITTLRTGWPVASTRSNGISCRRIGWPSSLSICQPSVEGSARAGFAPPSLQPRKRRAAVLMLDKVWSGRNTITPALRLSIKARESASRC